MITHHICTLPGGNLGNMGWSLNCRRSLSCDVLMNGSCSNPCYCEIAHNQMDCTAYDKRYRRDHSCHASSSYTDVLPHSETTYQAYGIDPASHNACKHHPSSYKRKGKEGNWRKKITPIFPNNSYIFQFFSS